MFFRSTYKAGMTLEDQNLLRSLRSRGFAVAVFPPGEVGASLNRSVIEKSMVQAGREAIHGIRRKEECNEQR